MNKKVKTTEDDDFDEKAYSSLMKDIKKLNSNARSGVERIVRVSSEASQVIDKREILKRLGDSTLVIKTKNQKSLPKPLEKPQAKRLKRAAGYEEVAVDANKWTGIVRQRRKADQLKFPVEDVDVRVITTEKNFIPPMKSDLEKEIYPLLYGAQLIEDKKETEEEIAVKKATSLKEVREKSKLLWQRKLLRQRLEKKAALMNKSKSRKFHKILRREKLKKKKEEFENLKETNPEKALDILNEIEKSRIQERMDLRHRKSKWLHLQQDRAGHDKNVMELLHQNKEISQEILEKIKGPESDNEYEPLSDDEFSKKTSQENKAHELMNLDEEQDDFNKFQSDVEKMGKAAASETLIHELKEDSDKVIIQPSKLTTRVLGSARNQNIFSKQWSNNFDDSDEDVVNFENIYNEEELIAEFQEEKKRKEEEKAKRMEDDGKIKGWGSWVGPGIKSRDNNRRRRRILRTSTDVNKSITSSKPHIMYNESADVNSSIRKHMVSELPYPFARVKDFEASMRQPVGRKYIPEIAHKMLIAPPVVKKMGTIINPIKEDALLKAHEKYKKKLSKLEQKFNEEIYQKRPRKKMDRRKRTKNSKSTLKAFVIHK